MSDPKAGEPKETGKVDPKQTDSFGQPVEKSPWGVFALLQIPIVIIMCLIIYAMYQAQKGD